MTLCNNLVSDRSSAWSKETFSSCLWLNPRVLNSFSAGLTLEADRFTIRLAEDLFWCSAGKSSIRKCLLPRAHSNVWYQVHDINRDGDRLGKPPLEFSPGIEGHARCPIWDRLYEYLEAETTYQLIIPKIESKSHHLYIRPTKSRLSTVIFRDAWFSTKRT